MATTKTWCGVTKDGEKFRLICWDFAKSDHAFRTAKQFLEILGWDSPSVVAPFIPDTGYDDAPYIDLVVNQEREAK
jgi:hypothetical protein